MFIVIDTSVVIDLWFYNNVKSYCKLIVHRYISPVWLLADIVNSRCLCVTADGYCSRCSYECHACNRWGIFSIHVVCMTIWRVTVHGYCQIATNGHTCSVNWQYLSKIIYRCLIFNRWWIVSLYRVWLSVHIAKQRKIVELPCVYSVVNTFQFPLYIPCLLSIQSLYPIIICLLLLFAYYIVFVLGVLSFFLPILGYSKLKLTFSSPSVKTVCSRSVFSLHHSKTH